MKLIDIGGGSLDTYPRRKNRMAPILRGHSLHGAYPCLEERFGNGEGMYDAASELEKDGFGMLEKNGFARGYGQTLVSWGIEHYGPN